MRRLTMCCVLLAVIIAPAYAQAPAADGDRPTIHVMVRPVGQVPAGAGNPFTPTAVSKEIERILTARGYRAVAVRGGALPKNATTLRLMYIVNERNLGGGSLVAIAAASNMLQTVSANNGQATLSLYNGVQQSVAQRGSLAESRERARQAFAAELADRLSTALDAYQQTNPR